MENVDVEGDEGERLKSDVNIVFRETSTEFIGTTKLER